VQHGVFHRGGLGGFANHARSGQDVTLSVNVLAGVVDQSGAVAVAPRGLARVKHTSVGSSPHQLGVVSLTPFDRRQALHPLLNGYGENIGVQRGLGQGEHGFEPSGNVGRLASGDPVHVDDMRMSAEVGVAGDVGDEGLVRSRSGLKPLLEASQL